MDSARADLQGEIRDLRDFIRTGLQAAAEGKEVPTELPNSDALAAETVMKYGIFICYCLACVLVTVLVTVADRFRNMCCCARDQLAAAAAECVSLREQLAAIQTKQESLEQGLDPLPGSIKELAKIVGSITANTDRAERRSILLQEQVEDLHARWNEAGQVIDEAYSRPGSAFSRPGSALGSDGFTSATHSRPGTRELAFPEPDGLALELGARPRSVQRPQSVARVEEAAEEEEEEDAP